MPDVVRRYRTIVADPPWQVMAGPLRADVGEGWQFRPGSGASRPLAYKTMTVAEIAALPVMSLADDDCALFLWTINAYVEDAYRIARAWGFHSEYILFARRGSPDVKRTIGTWFTWKRQFTLTEACLGWDVWGNESANTAEMVS
jgi:hypothetical protein